MSDGTKQKTISGWGGYSQISMEALKEHHTIHSPASWSIPATAPPPSSKGLLEERESTHGDFADVSRVAQEIKDAISRGPNLGKLSPIQVEALSMIASKIGRVLSGDQDFADHWDDIAGYAKLVADRVR